MALSSEEQQLLEEFRHWWRTNAVWVMLGAGLVLAGVGGYKGWDYWQDQRMLAAGGLYQAYRMQLSEEQISQAHALAARLRDEYGATPYASMASLISARLHVEDGRREDAIRVLGWVRENADDALFAPLAALRLARLHAAGRQWEEGFAALEGVSLVGFEALAHEIRGDLYRQSGDAQQARHEYSLAREQGAASEFLQLKRAELGE